MQDLNDKITGNTLTAVEWNELPSEVQNVIEALGQTLTSGDLNQLGKGIAGYVANGTFYTDSGIADAYVLTKIGTKQTAPSYTDGFFVSFLAGNTNTGASTVNVAGLGVKDIVLPSGVALASGDVSGRIDLVFDSANDRFEITNAKVSGKKFDFPTTVEMTAAKGLEVGGVVTTEEKTAGEQGGGAYSIIAGTGTADGFGILAHDTENISFDLRFNAGGWVNARQFGNTGEAINAALAVANYVYCTRGTYLTSNTVALSTNKYLLGEGLTNTNIQGTADGVPAKIVEFNGASKSNFQNINVTWLGASDIGVSFFESSKCNALAIGGNALNQDSGAGTTHGTFIKMDMGTDTSAYTHKIKDCDSQGADFYIDSIGPITGCIFADNKGRSADGYRFSKGPQVGSAPIAGNRITGNLIQAYSAATFGTGTGLDFGVGDPASPTHTFNNYIENNYIERWDAGVLFRDGAKNNFVGANEWDNNTTDITDSNADKDGYNEIGTRKFVKLAEYSVEFRPFGLRFTNYITGDINYDGDKIDKAVAANGTTVSVNGRTLRMDGSGAPRTGTILDKPGDDVDGQTLKLTGLTWSVTFVTTNIDIAAGFTMGNGSGEISGFVFEWDKSNQKWVPMSAPHVRP